MGRASSGNRSIHGEIPQATAYFGATVTMVGDFSGARRPTNRSPPGRMLVSWWYVWLLPGCAALLLLAGGVVFALIRQIASTPAVAPTAITILAYQTGESRPEERAESCRGVVCPEPGEAPKVAETKVTDTEVPETKVMEAPPEGAQPPPHARETEPGELLPDAEQSTPQSDLIPQNVLPQPDPRKPERTASEPTGLPQLKLPPAVAAKVGEKIWLNETGGNRDAITSWNSNEDFASLGIGHFLWFPAGKKAPFEESFPLLIAFLRDREVKLPAMVDATPVPPCPWVSRADFRKNFNSPKMKELRQFLLGTVGEQTEFLLSRAQEAMGKILQSTRDDADRQHIITQFKRIVEASNDLYPVIDYINFKGEGVNEAEMAGDPQTGIREGWGLKQVLLKMDGTTDIPSAVLAEFATAAEFVLLRRIHNIPANRVWQAGWLGRVETYRHPIDDAQPNPKTGEPPRRRG